MLIQHKNTTFSKEKKLKRDQTFKIFITTAVSTMKRKADHAPTEDITQQD